MALTQEQRKRLAALWDATPPAKDDEGLDAMLTGQEPPAMASTPPDREQIKAILEDLAPLWDAIPPAKDEEEAPPCPRPRLKPLPPPMNPPKTGNGRPAAPPQDPAKANGEAIRQKVGQRFAMLNAFVDAGMVGLSRVELATWIVLFRDSRDGIACTSMGDIATRIGCSTRAVVNAIRCLRRRGLLFRTFKGSNLRGPSRYRLFPVPKPPKR